MPPETPKEPTPQTSASGEEAAVVAPPPPVNWSPVLWATLGVVMVLVGRYLTVTLSPMPDGMALTTVLFDAGANEPYHFGALGQWWRPVTATLLHASDSHLLVNVLWLSLLIALCGRLGLVRPMGAVTLATLSAIAGEVASGLLTDGMSVGASGGIFGLLGVAFWRGGVAPVPAIAAWQRWSLLLVGMLALVSQLAGMSAHVLGVDHVAHLTGLVTGVLLCQTSLVATEWTPTAWAVSGATALLLVGSVAANALADDAPSSLVTSLEEWSAPWSNGAIRLPSGLPDTGIEGSLSQDGRCTPATATSSVRCRLVPHQFAVLSGPTQDIHALAPELLSQGHSSAGGATYRCTTDRSVGEVKVVMTHGANSAIVMVRDHLLVALPSLQRLATSVRCLGTPSPALE